MMKRSSLGLVLGLLGSVIPWPSRVTAQMVGDFTTPVSRTAIAPLQVPQALPPTISPDNQALRHLPAPPPLIANERTTAPPNGQELVFQRSTKTVTPKTFAHPVVPAPVLTPPIASDARIVPSNPSLYRVQVMGNSPQLLAQVRKIEPLAFIREADNTIQAGTFPEASLAQQRIHLLTEQGIPAQLVNVPDAAGMPRSSMALRYQIR